MWWSNVRIKRVHVSTQETFLRLCLSVVRLGKLLNNYISDVFSSVVLLLSLSLSLLSPATTSIKPRICQRLRKAQGIPLDLRDPASPVWETLLPIISNKGSLAGGSPVLPLLMGRCGGRLVGPARLP